MNSTESLSIREAVLLRIPSFRDDFHGLAWVWSSLHTRTNIRNYSCVTDANFHTARATHIQILMHYYSDDVNKQIQFDDYLLFCTLFTLSPPVCVCVQMRCTLLNISTNKFAKQQRDEKQQQQQQQQSATINRKCFASCCVSFFVSLSLLTLCTAPIKCSQRCMKAL